VFSEGLSACNLLGFQSRLEGVCRVQIFDLYCVRERLVGSSGRRSGSFWCFICYLKSSLVVSATSVLDLSSNICILSELHLQLV
jgi:hypothetical protein